MNTPVGSEHSTTDRLTERAHQSVDQVAKTAGKAEERIRHDAASAEALAKETGQKIKEHSDQTLHSISAYVRENPLMSLGIAFAAGTLLSALRRRS